MEHAKGYVYEAEGARVELRGDAERHGVSSLQLPGLPEVVQDRLYLLNAYRLLATGRLLAIARQQPFTVQPLAEGLRLSWPESDQHPVAMQFTYTVGREGSVDLAIELTARQAVPGYELFISSYFTEPFDPYLIIPQWAGKPDLHVWPVRRTPVIAGNYVFAPRDNAAAALRYDGRWDGPGGRPIARWSVGQFYGAPIGVAARGGAYVVQMAEQQACASVNASYASDDPADGIAHHHALYFGLFGENLPAGAHRRTRLRQVVGLGAPELATIMGLYEAFVGEE